MAVRITCITKDKGFPESRYTSIVSMGWVNETTGATGISTRIQIYDFLSNGGAAYVNDFFNNKAYLMMAVTSLGTKYVKTVPDETITDNLLSLPECP